MKRWNIDCRIIPSFKNSSNILHHGTQFIVYINRTAAFGNKGGFAFRVFNVREVFPHKLLEQWTVTLAIGILRIH